MSDRQEEFEDTKEVIRMSDRQEEFEDTKQVIRMSDRQEEFEDTKQVIRIVGRKRADNTMTKRKRTNNNLQNMHIKLKFE